jgi:hypothetical protein
LASQEFGNDFKNGSSKVGKLYTVMYLWWQGKIPFGSWMKVRLEL